ncbi:hypothetical protein Ancab_008561, partial [Ancistrocladus abbreviatus]
MGGKLWLNSGGVGEYGREASAAVLVVSESEFMYPCPRVIWLLLAGVVLWFVGSKLLSWIPLLVVVGAEFVFFSGVLSEFWSG